MNSPYPGACPNIENILKATFHLVQRREVQLSVEANEKHMVLKVWIFVSRIIVSRNMAIMEECSMKSDALSLSCSAYVFLVSIDTCQTFVGGLWCITSSLGRKYSTGFINSINAIAEWVIVLTPFLEFLVFPAIFLRLQS